MYVSIQLFNIFYVMYIWKLQGKEPSVHLVKLVERLIIIEKLNKFVLLWNLKFHQHVLQNPGTEPCSLPVQSDPQFRFSSLRKSKSKLVSMHIVKPYSTLLILIIFSVRQKWAVSLTSHLIYLWRKCCRYKLISSFGEPQSWFGGLKKGWISCCC